MLLTVAWEARWIWVKAGLQSHTRCTRVCTQYNEGNRCSLEVWCRLRHSSALNGAKSYGAGVSEESGRRVANPVLSWTVSLTLQ